jgi:general secretion pathway protein D
MVRAQFNPGYNLNMMRRGCLFPIIFLSIAAFCLVAFGDDQPQNVLILSCAQASPANAACNPSKADLKKAKVAFDKALKLQKDQHADQALAEFDTAARLVPANVEYVTALALARQQLVLDHVERGNADLLKGSQVEAQAEFRAALDLDPQNDFARQRLQDSFNEWTPKPDSTPSVLEDSGEITVNPRPDRHEFHFRGDGRELLIQVASAYGVSASFDDKLVTRHVRFDLESVDFYTAMRAACGVTRTFWAPVADKQIIVAPESPENHRQYDQMAMRTFYLPGIATQQDAAEVANMLRTVFEIKLLNQQQLQPGVFVLRAPQGVLNAATAFLESWADSRPQVMLDIHLFQISHNLTRNLGMHIPNDFHLYNIPTAALAALGGQSIQSLINQLISGGGINQANSQSISALLAQLQGQQNSIFSQPLATFGGGLTFMGLSLDHFTAELGMNQSWVRTLDHASFRVGQGSEATFKVGSRYPILNASFAPIFNSAAISSVLQNGSFQAPFPSFSYEDIGLNVKAKAVVNSDSHISLDLELQLRAIESQSFNGVPVIGNREYKGSITLVDGEPAVVAGELDQNEQRSMTGIPGLGSIPGLNKIMTTNSAEEDSDEMLLVITPHIISQTTRGPNSLVWLPKE